MLKFSQKISLLFILPVIFLGIILLFVTKYVITEFNENDHIRWGYSLTSSLSESLAEPVINQEKIKTTQILRRVLSQNPNLVFIYVIDFEGYVFSHTFDKGVPTALLEGFSAGEIHRHYRLNKTPVFEIRAPLIEGMQGQIHIGIDSSAGEHFVQVTIVTLILIFAILILITLLLGKFIGREIGLPLDSLNIMLKRFASDSPERSTDLIQIDNKSWFDEINDVTSSFNKMTAERLQYIDEINRSNASLERAQSIAHVGNWEWDVESGILQWSNEVFKIFGYEPQEIVPTYEKFIEMIHAEDRRNVIDAISFAIKQPDESYKVEHRIIQPSGQMRWVEEMGDVITKNNKPVNMIGVVHDITERKKAELVVRAYQDELETKVNERTEELLQANIKLQQLDHLKSMFIASMSHELRTPLNSIIGFTSVMLKGLTGDLTVMQKDQLGRVNGSAKHLLALISDIIDISKIEAGRVDLVIEEVDFNELLDELLSNVSSLNQQRGNLLTTDIDPGIVLFTDRMRLSQVVLNILSNAAKYTEKGKIIVSARQDADQLKVVIEDTGVGVGKEDLQNIFEPFERIDNELSVKSGGTGLGLYLTKKLLKEVLRGDITVESELGKGSCFTIIVSNRVSETDMNYQTSDGVML